MNVPHLSAPPVQYRFARFRVCLSNYLAHIVLISAAFLMVFPLIWLISSSLKTPQQQYAWPPQIIPNPFHPQNYVELFKLVPMDKYLFNSFKVAILSVLGMCFSSSIAAFAFARMRFRGKELIFGVLLGTMMIPFAITMIPTFVVMRYLGWVDSHWPLVAPNLLGSAYMLFLLRQSYQTIPQDFVDAAQIDGAGFFTIYSRIFVQLGMPVMMTVALLTFLYSWNDLLTPLIYLNNQDKVTVALGLAFLRGRAGTGIERYGIIMAGSMLGVLPMLVLYIAGQRYFIQGLSRSGLKG
jgi:multiple sugar transport system permease protein